MARAVLAVPESARAERHALALERRNRVDMGVPGGHHMDFFQEEIGDEAHMLPDAGFSEIALAGDRFGDDVGLGEGAVGAAGIDIEDIGNGAGAGPHGGDEAGRTADAGRVAARDSGRMADDAGNCLSDREIGPPRRARRQFERNPARCRLGGAQAHRGKAGQDQRDCASQCGEGCESPFHHRI